MNKVPKILKAWCEGVSKGNPEYMTSFYTPNAILLATYEPIAVGRKKIHKYFVDFLDKEELSCKITCCINQVSQEGIIISNGFYTFSFRKNGKPQKVNARFTYVIKGNRIVTHHSSLQPD